MKRVFPTLADSVFRIAAESSLQARHLMRFGVTLVGIMMVV